MALDPLNPAQKGGRGLTTHTPEMVEQICELLRQGKSLNAIGNTPGLPTRATISKWCERYPDTARAIGAARYDGWDTLAEIALDEAVNATDDKKGRLALDARRWFLAKMNPERYGERINQRTELSGPGGRPIQTEAMSDEQVALELHAILSTLEARQPILELEVKPIKDGE